MSESVPDVPCFDDEGRLANDVFCVACGRNLRMRHREEVCPECGRPVEGSLRGAQLEHAEPRWLVLVGRGALMIAITTMISLAIQLLIVAISIMRAVGVPVPFSVDTSLGLLIGAVTVVLVIGVWLLTWVEPATADRERFWSLRRTTRALMVMNIVSAPLQLHHSATAGVGGLPSTTGQVVNLLALLVISTAAAIGWIFCVIHARRLALRGERPRLARHFKIVCVLYASCIVLTTLGSVGSVLLGTLVAGQVSVAQLVFGLLAFIGFVILVPTQIWQAVLCFALHVRLVCAGERSAASVDVRKAPGDADGH